VGDRPPTYVRKGDKICRHLSELKVQLFIKLEEYSEISFFYKEMLRERVERDNTLLENDLIYSIFQNNEVGLGNLQDAIKNANDNNYLDILQELMKKPKGSDKNCDKKINDTWAELNALSYLVDNKYKNIEINRIHSLFHHIINLISPVAADCIGEIYIKISNPG